MKNKGIIITLIIILSILVFGMILFLVEILNESKPIPMKIGIFGLKNKNEQIVYDEKYDLKNINNIKIKQDVGNLKIEKSTEENIRVVIKGKNNENINVNSDNEQLIIECLENNNAKNIFNIGINEKDIIIYLPENYSKEINIDSNNGDCEIDDFENANININCDLGNVKVGKIYNLNVVCDCGNIEINTVLNKCKLEANLGNINIENIQIKENSTIEADLGNIEIENINDIFVDAKVDFGDFKINKNNKNSEIILKIVCDLGNVKIK